MSRKSIKIIIAIDAENASTYGTMVFNAIHKAGISETSALHAPASHAFYDPIILTAPEFRRSESDIKRHSKDKRSFIKQSELERSEFDILVSLGPQSVIDEIDKHIKTYAERQRWIHIESVKEFVDNCADYLRRCYFGNIMMLPELAMPSPPVISIVTVSNDGEKLKSIWKSVQAQDAHYCNWEWIVYSNADLGFNDSRVVQVFDSNGGGKYSGLSKSRGFSVASGMYIVNLQDFDVLDNLLFKHFVHFLVSYESAKSCEFIYTDINSNTKLQIEHTAPTIDDILHISKSSGHIWRRDAYLSIGGYNAKLAIGEDYELVARAFAHGIVLAKMCVSGFIRSDDSTSVFEQYVIKLIKDSYGPAITKQLAAAAPQQHVWSPNL